MNASEPCLKWRPTVRRRAAAGRPCGAGQRAEPYPHLAVVAASLPALPRAFFFHPKSVQGTFGDFSPAPVKVGQTQSNPVKLWPATRPSRTPDPKPQTRKVGQAGSRSVKLGPAARHPRPKTRNPGPDGQSKRVKPLKPASPCPSKPIKITTH